MLSPFPVSPLETPYPILSPPPSMRVLTYPPCPTSPPWHSPTLSITPSQEQASPPTDVWQGHPLLHMWLEPRVPPCVLSGWWFSLWELWGHWMVHVLVPPIGLQTPSAPWLLSLAPLLGLASSIHLCICQALAVSQEIPISGSCQQVLVSIHTSL